MARADNLARPRATRLPVFGPQLYEAPLYCPSSDLIIPRAFGFVLAPGFSIAQYEATIHRKLYHFITTEITIDLETDYFTEGVDEQLLAYIRSDPSVAMVTCSLRDTSKEDWAMEASPEWNSDWSF